MKIALALVAGAITVAGVAGEAAAQVSVRVYGHGGYYVPPPVYYTQPQRTYHAPPIYEPPVVYYRPTHSYNPRPSRRWCPWW